MKALCIAALLLTFTPVLAADSPPPTPYSAVYRATFSGFTATAYRDLEQLEDGSYELEQSIEVKVLGARLGEVVETSHFEWIDGSLVPLFYEYNQSGVSRREESVEFDWQNGLAHSSEDDDYWRISLRPGVLDKLSFQLAVRQQLGSLESDELAVDMIDGDEIESHLYRVSEEEIIQTNLGRLTAVRVERVREGDSNRRTTFWLASDWDYLLVRLLQTSGSGTETELTLQSATIGERSVSPLP